MQNLWDLPLVEIAFETGTNEDWTDSVELLDEDGVTPLDIEGISFRMQVRKNAADTMVLIDASTENEMLLAGNGVIGRRVLRGRMSRVPPGDYVFDTIATRDGHAVRVEYGTVKVVQGVTR